MRVVRRGGTWVAERVRSRASVACRLAVAAGLVAGGSSGRSSSVVAAVQCAFPHAVDHGRTVSQEANAGQAAEEESQPCVAFA